MRRKSYVGYTFGRLKAVERIDRYNKARESNIAYYKCKCVCGNEVEVAYNNLTAGNTKSCGCLRKEVLHARKSDDKTIKLNELERYYKRNAKLRGYSWELTKFQVQSIVVKSCNYCGFDKDIVGIDRLDNTKGYTLENSVPCCKYCNFAKHDRTVNEFKKWVSSLHGHLFHK